MSRQRDYEKIVSDFEKAVLQMQKDLQYLADQNTLSTKFFDKQNNIIKALINYHHRTQSYIRQLEDQSLEYQKVKHQLIKYEDRIISFEAICIIHGIIDFPMWLSKGKETLLYEAEELGKNKKMRLSLLFNEKVTQLPIEDQKTVMEILQREVNEAVKKLLDKINKRGNKLNTCN